MPILKVRGLYSGRYGISQEDDGIDYCIAFWLYREPTTLEDLVTVVYAIPIEGDKATESSGYSKWFVPIYLTVKDHEDYAVVDDTQFLDYFKCQPS